MTSFVKTMVEVSTSTAKTKKFRDVIHSEASDVLNGNQNICI